MSECIFCKIIDGSIPSRKIYEDSSVISFLDINPAARGHSLIVPKTHGRLIMDLEDEWVSKTFVAVKKVSGLIKSKLDCDGFNILINQGRDAGQLVDHFHIHVIPRYSGDSLPLPHVVKKLTDEEMDEIQKKITG
ncbi:MAG: HIT family protein [Candidatus Hodarchaeota archaeon]